MAVSVTTDGHTGPYNVADAKVTVEHVFKPGDVSSACEIHPVCGLTNPGGYSGSASITWVSYEDSTLLVPRANYFRKAKGIHLASALR